MNRSQILLSLVLNEAGVPISVDEFDNRLLVQKSVYLLQQAGVQLGYPYSWYVRGPYSSRLASDLFYLAEMEGDESQVLGAYTLGEKTRNIVSKIKEFFAQPGSLAERAKELELLASVLFLLKTGQAKSDNEQEISNILKANGKPFEPDQAKRAVGLLHSHGYAF
jgi:uncharacterized protein YwgA